VTSQNTPETSNDTTTGGAGAKPRRRTTRKTPVAATPEPTTAPDEGAPDILTTRAPVVEPLTTQDTRPAAEAASSAADAAESAPAPRRRASRSRKAAVSEPASVEAPDRPVTAGEPSAERATTRRPRGERAAVVEPAAIESPTEPTAAGEPTATRTTTGRSRAKRASAEAPAVEQPPADETLPEEVVVEEAVEAAADEAEQAAAEPEPASAQSPRLATTAVLFQAPDLSQVRPRRRRATATAGSPEQISQAAHRAEAEAAAAERAEQPDEPEPGTVGEATGQAADEQAESRSRSRRRRGGRAQAADDEGLVVVEPAPEPAQAEEPAEEAEEEAEETEEGAANPRRRRRRGGRGRRGRGNGTAGEGAEPGAEGEAGGGEPADAEPAEAEGEEPSEEGEGTTTRRRRRRRRGARSEGAEGETHRRDEVTALRGSTRLEAKRQRRREGRDAGRRRQIITEAEFLARRESVDRVMVVRERGGRTQIAVLEDGVLVEHYVSDQAAASMVGNVYLGRVQNVLPSMEAAFVDVGKGRNAVLYAGEVNWDAAGLEGQPRRIEQALKSGDSVLVQVTKDPIGHKGARLTSQVTLAGRYLVYVPGGGMTGISRKLPDTERNRLKKILRDIVPDSAGVIVRTAAEGASEEELQADIARLTAQWEAIEAKSARATAPALLQGEPDMAIRVVRDIFNDDFSKLVVQGDEAWQTISSYVSELAPDLAARVSKWTENLDVFTVHRVDEQLAKGMDRKVWLPSGGSLVIDRTEAMTVIDVNTGKFTGAGGTLEETVTRNNLEAAEEIVRQLRLRDIGGIIVIDFIDMVLESNRDLVLRRLVECLGRDRTKHQVAEVTSLGLVQMTRKRVGQGLVEAFSETCEHCHGRGFIVHTEPIERGNGRSDAGGQQAPAEAAGKRSRRKRAAEPSGAPVAVVPVLPEAREAVKATLATIAAAAAHAHEHELGHRPESDELAGGPVTQGVVELPADEAFVVPAAIDETLVAPRAGDALVVPPAPAAEAAAEPLSAPAPVLDVLAELAAHLPFGDRPAPVEPDPTVLAELADLAGGIAAQEAPVAQGETPEVPVVPDSAQESPAAPEASVTHGGASDDAPDGAPDDEADDEPTLSLSPVDPAVFDAPDDAPEDESDDAPEDAPDDAPEE
jgi:ribonuclease E